MDLIPWGQLASLGAGGMLAVVILWLVFKFLGKRRAESDTIVAILGRQTNILESHTKILERLVDIGQDTKDDTLVIKTKLNCAAH